jgi:uncharacterized membrane protein YphA (DoxX/SURF4 family)
MQRLFSTFADGWPGVGLLLLRALLAVLLVYSAIARLGNASPFSVILPYLIAAVAGLLLLVGLWTPVVGALVAIVELWIVISHAGDPWTPSILAVLGAILAMIGPGAWSVDARLFGRKYIETSDC